ncbi:SIR2 family protein [uncultured Pseudomonas sp.]|uniref:SIR2 family protein n=1 Tax=uncultured Pseudomonas sp. TaxID=114707 RepID=UPI0028046467|nr:SIR2 family protein [uncultured Pseudomonas sp.]
MRFIPDGPSIPDELLSARDSDEVLFFCGAGVSQAEAYLPNFVDLLEKVLELLGSAQDSPARRLFIAGKQSEKATGLAGLVATDRIFGMLEREFEPVEVREAVAIALKPKFESSLSAHRTMLDLSRTRAGVARLVTTNFDLLFEACEPGIVSSNPPHLPDPRRDIDFRGVIHLHGRVDADYRRACDDEFVLSSADFGHAYLSDGWATRYIQALLRRFRIVFVGYSAEDPPVQYLLEALNRFEKPSHKLYAFQSGDATQAMAQWAHKGVVPIAYESANGHAALWKTLSAWAERARDVDGWNDRLILSASHGPALMAPHERGMIAHLASTASGARLLAAANNPPPAHWLCVFDRNNRYAQIERIERYNETSSHFDPFDAFGLDSDIPPIPVDPDNIFTKREVQQDAWNGVGVLPLDRTDLLPEGVSKLCGVRSETAADLPSRLWHLGMWLVRVSHQPAALWWAAKQSNLHPHIQQRIEWSLRQNTDQYPTVIRDGWRILMVSWQQKSLDVDMHRYAIEANTKLEGWSPLFVREYIGLYKPRLTVRPIGVKAPDAYPELALKELLSIDVEYSRPHKTLDIPSDMLSYATALFRQTLEHAVQIERETNGHDGLYFDTTRPDDDSELDEDGYGLTGHLAIFTKMMSRLTEENRAAARKETAQWYGLDDPLFTRLRIWAAGRKNLTSPEEAGQIFLDLNDDTFWSARQKRDLLFSLRDRWSDIPPSMITRIEARILESRIDWMAEREDRDELVAYCRLCRLHWLSSRGVVFSFDLEAEIEKQRLLAPDWTEESSEDTARPSISRVFSIQADRDFAPLDRLPIGEVLGKAIDLDQYNFDSHVQRQSFYGYAAHRPTRALSVLTDAARKKIFVPWAWSALLSPNNDKTMSSRLISTIGLRLTRLPAENLAEIVNPVSEWFNSQGKRLVTEAPVIFDLVWNALVAALMVTPELKRYPRPDRTWIDESVTSPVGLMIESLFNDPANLALEPGVGLPVSWHHRINQVLSLPDDHRSHAIVMISSRLNWLYHIDPSWTEGQFISFADGDGEESEAFWAGYLWRAQKPQRQLYSLLKPGFISLACRTGQRRNHARTLAGLLLSGWGDHETSLEFESKTLITDVEMREILIHTDDNLRTQILWYLEHWSLEKNSLWDDRLMPFLTKVWPRQRDVRTSLVSARLVDLALSLPNRFPEIVDSILPKLVIINGESLRIITSLTTGSSNTIAERHPQALLNLLCAILGEDPMNWPYGIEKLFTQLAEKEETQNDPRLAELIRREQRR